MSTTCGEEMFIIGHRLKDERVRLGLSQDALAKKLDTSGRTVQKWETNETSPRANDLAVFHSLGADVHYIVTGIRLPVGVEQKRASYTPAEHLAEELSRLKLSQEDASILALLARRLAGVVESNGDAPAGPPPVVLGDADMGAALRKVADNLNGKTGLAEGKSGSEDS